MILLGGLTNAVRAAGLKMGYYYSLYEWYNPLWLGDKKRYVEEHLFPQFKDLVTRYKPSVIFSDGEWDMSDKDWKAEELLAWLYNESPVADEVVVNDRWGKDTRGKNTKSTYTTSEYGSGMDATITWEENQGIGHSYGYNRNEIIADYKSVRDLKLLLVDVVSRGGNLLLNIGPRADGRIPVYMENCLLALGEWLEVNGEAIYGTTAYELPKQWSEGEKRDQQAGHYMSGYRISDYIKKDSLYAYVEAFFTKKGKDLYCIIPGYDKASFKLRNTKLRPGVRAILVASGKELTVSQIGEDCLIDLSRIRPGEIDDDLFVVRLENMF